MKLKIHDLQDTVQKLSASIASCCNAGLPSLFAAATASNCGRAKGNMQSSSIEVGMVELGQVVWLGEVNLKCRVTAVMV